MPHLLPPSLTRILSESMIVLRRWAMVNTVQSMNCSLIASWMMLSVLWRREKGRKKREGRRVIWPRVTPVASHQGQAHLMSTLAVASSRTRILLLLSRALARHTSWRWPTLKLAPPSVTCACSPPSSSSTTAFSCTCGWQGHHRLAGGGLGGGPRDGSLWETLLSVLTCLAPWYGREHATAKWTWHR